MPKNDFKEYLCRPYCIFFQDGTKEELACQGAQVVERLVKENRIAIAALPPPGKEPAAWQNEQDELGRSVCRRCSFRAEDCDFQAPDPPDDAEPCGGFILLARLRQKNLIGASDLEDL